MHMRSALPGHPIDSSLLEDGEPPVSKNRWSVSVAEPTVLRGGGVSAADCWLNTSSGTSCSACSEDSACSRGNHLLAGCSWFLLLRVAWEGSWRQICWAHHITSPPPLPPPIYHHDICRTGISGSRLRTCELWRSGDTARHCIIPSLNGVGPTEWNLLKSERSARYFGFESIIVSLQTGQLTVASRRCCTCGWG